MVQLITYFSSQVDLIDEQQRLLVDVHLDSGVGGGSTTTTATRSEPMSSSTAQHIVAERKQQRQALLVRRDRINGERENQMLEKKEILSMLEQLLTLEARFVMLCVLFPLFLLNFAHYSSRKLGLQSNLVKSIRGNTIFTGWVWKLFIRITFQPFSS